MSNPSDLPIKHLGLLRQLIEQAVSTVETEGGSARLRDLLYQCRNLASARGSSTGGRGDDFIEYTVEDEACEPFGREIDLRIYFDWNDPIPHESSHTPWGASITDLEVLAVRYLDERGNAVSADDHLLDEAWEMVEQQRESIEALCHQEIRGSRGRTPSQFAIPRDLRMAPSERDRSETGHRKHG